MNLHWYFEKGVEGIDIGPQSLLRLRWIVERLATGTVDLLGWWQEWAGRLCRPVQLLLNS